MDYLYNKYKENGIVKEGHFKLTSGRHSNLYVNKDAIYCNPELLDMTESAIINTVIHTIPIEKYDVVTGPALAGAILAVPVAMDSSKRFIYPEKIDGKMVFRRGYEHVIPGKKILIVEDIITTGGSVQKTADAITALSGIVVGVISIWNRSGWQLEGAENMTLIDKSVDSWEPEDCPLCKDKIPLTDPKG